MWKRSSASKNRTKTKSPTTRRKKKHRNPIRFIFEFLWSISHDKNGTSMNGESIHTHTHVNGACIRLHTCRHTSPIKILNRFENWQFMPQPRMDIHRHPHSEIRIICQCYCYYLPLFLSTTDFIFLSCSHGRLLVWICFLRVHDMYVVFVSSIHTPALSRRTLGRSCMASEVRNLSSNCVLLFLCFLLRSPSSYSCRLAIFVCCMKAVRIYCFLKFKINTLLKIMALHVCVWRRTEHVQRRYRQYIINVSVAIRQHTNHTWSIDFVPFRPRRRLLWPLVCVFLHQRKHKLSYFCRHGFFAWNLSSIFCVFDWIFWFLGNFCFFKCNWSGKMLIFFLFYFSYISGKCQ